MGSIKMPEPATNDAQLSLATGSRENRQVDEVQGDSLAVQAVSNRSTAGMAWEQIALREGTYPDACIAKWRVLPRRSSR
jgi:hypothetical protein